MMVWGHFERERQRSQEIERGTKSESDREENGKAIVEHDKDTHSMKNAKLKMTKTAFEKFTY